jgi:hypothetical protein
MLFLSLPITRLYFDVVADRKAMILSHLTPAVNVILLPRQAW